MRQVDGVHDRVVGAEGLIVWLDAVKVDGGQDVLKAPVAWGFHGFRVGYWGHRGSRRTGDIAFCKPRRHCGCFTGCRVSGPQEIKMPSSCLHVLGPQRLWIVGPRWVEGRDEAEGRERTQGRGVVTGVDGYASESRLLNLRWLVLETGEFLGKCRDVLAAPFSDAEHLAGCRLPMTWVSQVRCATSIGASARGDGEEEMRKVV